MDKSPSTILIADDEQAMREALGELLIEEGYDVEFAKNGAEAVAKAAEIIPNLILLDVMMPDMDGFAVCRNLRADRLLAQVPIIMITSLGDRTSRLKGFEAGADDYVSKPIDGPELLARVKTTTHLNRYRRLLEEQVNREMAEKELQHSLEEVARSQQLLLALSQAAQAVQRARTPDEIYKTIGDEIVNLGYHVLVLIVTEDKEHLITTHITLEPDLLLTAEKLLGFTAREYRIPLKSGSFYQQILAKGETTFTVLNAKSIVDALPKAIRPLAGKLVDLLKLSKSIFAPLQVGGETYGLMMVWGNDLQETDVPAITAFAGQAAIAIQNAQLYQTAQQERDKVQRYLDIAGVMLVAINAAGEITLINRKGCEILEYKERKILGKNWFDICIPGEIRQDVRAVFERLIAGEIQPVEYYENPIVTKSGKKRLIAWHNIVLRDEAGAITGTLSSGEDITKRKQAEEALRENEKWLESILTASAVGIAHAKDRKILWANDAMAKLFGFTKKGHYLGKATSMLYASEEEYSRIGKIAYEQQQAGRSIEFDAGFKRHDGSLFDGHAKVNPLDPLDPLKGIIVSIIDITERVRSEQERVRAEEALHQSEETARALLNATDDLAILITPDGSVLAGNERAAQEIGADEMIGATIEDFVSADLLEIGTAQADQVRRSREAVRFQAERQGATLDISIYPVFGPKGDLAHFAVFARDVTEQIKARQAVEQRNRELAALNDIGQAIVSTLDLQEMLTLIAEHTNQLMGMAATSIVLREEADDGLYFAAASGEGADEIVGQRLAIDQGIAGWVIQHEKPVLIPDASQDTRWYSALDDKIGFSTRSILCVPLKSKAYTIGALEAINKPDGFTEDDLHLLSAMAAPIATAIENARLFKEVRTGREQLQSLSRRLVEMQEAERAHVARELHDETGQALSGMLLSLSLLEQEADQPEAVRDRANELLVLVDDMLENLHRLAMNLRPATLDHLGLLPALEQYVETFEEQYGIETQFEVVNLGSDRLPPEMETALYRIVQESLTNVVRHAQATRVDVLVARRDDQVVTIVEDNGGGFDPEMAMRTSRLGLLGIRERAEMLNGRLVIESVPGSG
ncbi:MAG: PAS domain S-box protein, partial [Anaerolineae bacterium]|nr:PAS domain S-box protein [Anaerolineae bacterium]